MRELPNSWPTSAQYQGIKFITQIFDEMFFDYTADSYRTPALSTLHRAHEGHYASNQILSQNLNPKTVQPIVQEMIYSINNDPIAKSILKDRCSFISNNLKSAQDKPKLARDLFAYIRDAIDDEYAHEAHKLLIAAIHTPHQKEYIQKLCREFGAYLVNVGYTRQYIRHKINEKLLTGRITDDPEYVLVQFLSCFDETNQSFHAYVWVSHTFRQYLQEFSSFTFKKLNPGKTNSLIRRIDNDFFKQRRGYDLIRYENISEKDPAAARDFISRLLNIHRSFIHSITPESKFAWQERVLIYTPSKQEGVSLTRHQAPLLRRSSVPSSEAASRTERRIDTILSHLDRSSYEQVTRALTSFSNAFNSESEETQFVSVWSALEVLLPDPVDHARIITYVEYVNACAALHYSYRNFSWVFSDLKNGSDMKSGYGDAFIGILEDEEKCDSHMKKFITIMCCPEYEETRNKLCEMAADNPLALWRLFQLRRDHESPDAIQKLIKRHVERVEWQMHRIYRTRNSLLHSGQTLPYLEAVLMNMQEYFCNIMDTMEERLRSSPKKNRKDTILKEISLDWKLLESRLQHSKGQEISSDNVFNFVWLPNEKP